jgi:hypothetical protein
MVLASEAKEGTGLQLDDRPYKVREVVRHAGNGQSHGSILAERLKFTYSQ